MPIVINQTGVSQQALLDSKWDKKYFEGQGLLPSVQVLNAYLDLPTPNFQNLRAGDSFSQDMSLGRAILVNVASADNVGYDLGANYSQALFVVGGYKASNNATLQTFGIWVADSLAAAAELPNGAYMFNCETNNGQQSSLYKRSGGAFVPLANTGTGRINYTGMTGMALYRNSASGRLVAFYRNTQEQWWPIFDLIDASFASVRSVGFRFDPGSAPGNFFITPPVALYRSAA